MRRKPPQTKRSVSVRVHVRIGRQKMASLCKRQQCMIERRGIRQDLDSWRYKLIQCVGFESILEGLFGSRLKDDLRLFKDCQPEGVSDWSFDENCLFCCLRREKVKEHLLGLNNDSLGSVARPLSFIKDQFNISNLEREAEEFLNAVLHRKDLPSFSDPDIPVVAREIMQRMIRQFAAEYTSKTSAAQGAPQPNGASDQSLLTTHSHTPAPAPAPAPAATAPATLTSARNPVLSQLLMAEQEAPLDLTVKKPDAIVCEQDGVLDLSTNKSRNKGAGSARAPTAPLVKGDSHDLDLAYASDLQSTSDLERFMAKLCLHHQRQIVDALGYLETEVKADASSSVSNVAARDERQPGSCGLVPCQQSSEVQCSSKARCKAEVLELAIQGHGKKVALEKNTYFPDSRNVPGNGSLLDLRKDNILSSLLTSSHEYETLSRQYQSPHGISSTSSLHFSQAKDKVSSGHLFFTGTLEEQQCASDNLMQTSSRESDIDVSPSYDRHEFSEPLQSFPIRTKDIQTRPLSVLRTSAAVSPNTPRTARKSRRGSFPRTKDGSLCRIDPDSHCDIVYIGKSITECQLESSNRMLPRRNARKSIRGHMYTEEFLELKTVRTLARKSAENGSGNCPAPMPVITLVTPKQVLAKPDGVPPVDMPFAGGCGESVVQTTPSETPVESEMLGDVLTNVNDVDVVVETSQTGQTTCPDKIDAPPEVITPVTVQKGSPSEQDEDVCTAEPLSQQSMELPATDDLEKADFEQNNESVENSEPVLEMTTKEDPPCEQSPKPLSVSDDKGIDEPCVVNESPALAQEDDLSLKDKETNVVLKEQNVGLHVSADVEGLSETSALAEEAFDDTTQDDEVLDEHSGTETELSTVRSSCEKEEKEVDEPTSEYTCSDTPPETYLEKEEVAREVLSSPESKKLKKRRTFGSSDRRLRSRASGVEEGSTTPEKNDKTASAQVSDSAAEEPKSPETKRPLRSVKAKPLASDVSTSEAQHSAEVCKEPTQQSSTDQLDKTADSSSSENPEADYVVLAKKMLRSGQAKQTLDQEGEQKAVSPVANITDAQISTTEELEEKKETPETDKSLSDMSEQTGLKDLHVPDPPSKDSLMEPLSPESDPSLVTSPRVSRHMPLRSKTSPVDSITPLPMGKSSTENTVEKSGHMPLRSASTIVADDAHRDSRSTSTSSAEEKFRYMPLRSRIGIDSDGSSSAGNHSESAGRMPLRSSSIITPMSPTTSARARKAQRSPRLSKFGVLSSDTDTEQKPIRSPRKTRPGKVTQGQMKGPVMPFILPGIPNSEPVAPNPHKFLQALRREENQHLVMNLNTKFDKMHKGWVHTDKEGPQTPRSRNKADRLKDIWKSKRRIRKPRSLEPHKFSPVQMLFMKSFDLPSICRWFLQSTETKSLVIVKKVNTRLPSETQLFFNSSSSMAGTSHGVFPSVQAERLKKHLKKFAIASPVKSNAKSQKLIAEALEKEPIIIKSKEKGPLTTATRMSTKPPSFRGASQSTESQKASGVGKNPASARILRKYSNIREKLQGQQQTRKPQSRKDPKAGNKGPSKQKLSSKQQKLALSKRSGGKGTKVPKKEKAKQSPLSKKSAARTSGKEKVTKTTSSKALKEHADKDGPAPKRVQQAQVSPKPQRVQQAQASPKPQRTITATPLSPKANTHKKESPAEKHGGEKSLQTTSSDSKADIRKTAPTKALGSPEPSVAQDQVLTRSQRKMEAAQRLSESPKSATKRAQDPVVTPVKRTRTSLSKTN
ncbi:uncharacterized protein wu:fc17b08 isoform X4 [Clupea harengus]|uniref:Uncharacterized protein wu:fc17b08 isoform X4 n=1 Tax=Clupea harengus TaxID=7950 RepID=A0A6P8GHF3_CLUHA|nr:uncharacterized protein wu:fc17b08 isoform X4 [Clupea harengus]